MYRDLKPENVLLTREGHIMLSDFDLSKTQPPQLSMTQAINSAKEMMKKEPKYITNSFVGTAEYLAPEVIVGYGYSGTVDWWTFGIFMYELLYGRTPFHSRVRDEVFSQILDGDVVFPKTWYYPVSSHAKDLIKKLLVTEPERRLGTKKGAEEIMNHKFFKGVKFQLIRNTVPPIIPQINGAEDTHHFNDLKDDGEIERLEMVAKNQKEKKKEKEKKDKDKKKDSKKSDQKQFAEVLLGEAWAN